jgi:hypothetical protein
MGAFGAHALEALLKQRDTKQVSRAHQENALLLVFDPIFSLGKLPPSTSFCTVSHYCHCT